MERRGSTRFRIRCEVKCTWTDEFGVENTTFAYTRDISAGGLFILCNERPSPGAMAQLDIRLPGRQSAGTQLCLHGTGRVVRLIQDKNGGGFAVARNVAWSLSRPRQTAVSAR